MVAAREPVALVPSSLESGPIPIRTLRTIGSHPPVRSATALLSLSPLQGAFPFKSFSTVALNGGGRGFEVAAKQRELGVGKRLASRDFETLCLELA